MTPRPRARYAIVAIFSLVGAAAGASQRPETSRTRSPEGYPEVGQPPTVTVLAPGSAPRTALRYAVPATYKGRMGMTMAMAMGMETGESTPAVMPLPVMKMIADLSVTGVSATGDVSYTIAFHDMSVEAGPGVDAAAAATMNAAMSGLSAVRATAIVSNRGVTSEVNLALDQITNPLIRQTMGSMSSSIQSMSMTLPEEPVGVGARWRMRQAVPSEGMAVYQETDYQLLSMTGSTVALKVTVRQTAPPQPVANPALPPGVDVQLENLTGTGEGTVQVHLDTLIPVSELHIATSASTLATMGATSQRMRVATTLKLTIGPVK
jgi:hypothetical protein